MIPAMIICGVALILYLLFFLENRRFTVTQETIAHDKAAAPFTVVQVSDLHDRCFGKGQTRLIAAIQKAQPDIIVITGDLFNRRNRRAYKNAFAFVKEAVRIAPTYFAEGNHECALGKTGKRFIKHMRAIGVRVLKNEYIDLPQCRLIGLRQYALPETLSSMLDAHRLNLVLAHRPERFPLYAETGADLILSGHAHGGQIRLFGHGLYAPQQGLFPRFTAGVYRIGASVLYVSRGLGNTIPFPRVFDTPELNRIVITPTEPKGV